MGKRSQIQVEDEVGPEMVGLPAVAEQLDLHRATVNEMVRDGRLEARRVGARWYVSQSTLTAFASSYVRPKNAPKRARRSVVPSQQILDLLSEWGDATEAELAVVVQIHEGNIRKNLALANSLGLVERGEDGRWRLTDGRHLKMHRQPPGSAGAA